MRSFVFFETPYNLGHFLWFPYFIGQLNFKSVCFIKSAQLILMFQYLNLQWKLELFLSFLKREHECTVTVPWTFMELARELTRSSWNAEERSLNDLQTVRNAERLEHSRRNSETLWNEKWKKFTFTFTFQKRKKDCKEFLQFKIDNFKLTD